MLIYHFIIFNNSNTAHLHISIHSYTLSNFQLYKATQNSLFHSMLSKQIVYSTKMPRVLMYTVDTRPDAQNPGYEFLKTLLTVAEHLGPEEESSSEIPYKHRHHVFHFVSNVDEKWLADHGVPVQHCALAKNHESTTQTFMWMKQYADKSLKPKSVTKLLKEEKDRVRQDIIKFVKSTPGCSEKDLLEKFPLPCLYWSAKTLKNHLSLAPKRPLTESTGKKKVIWIYGPSNAGKTYFINDFLKSINEIPYEYSADDLEFKWHDNWDADTHDIIWMDDIGPRTCTKCTSL